MLKVKRTSSASGGNGRMTIASAARTPSGTPSPERTSERKSRGVAVAAMRYLRQNVGALTLPYQVATAGPRGARYGGTRSQFGKWALGESLNTRCREKKTGET